jgi:hypothetical protein
MNRNSKHIQSAIKRHYGAIGDGLAINPISKVDINIINEMVELFKKVNLPEAVDIMDNYKLDPDSSTLEYLMQLNTEMGGDIIDDDLEDLVEDYKNKKLPFWIHFNDTGRNRVIRPNIVNFAPLDAIGREQSQYGIILNKTPKDVKQVPFHANETLFYDDEEDREKDMKVLEKLSKY